MNCLDKYRSNLIAKINKNLRIIQEAPEEGPVHDFRVAVKRLTAFYYFLKDIDSSLKAKKILKPYRSLFKSIGHIRDGHIAVQLIQGLDDVNLAESKILLGALRSRIRKDCGLFKKQVRLNARVSIRMPSVSAMGISERAILQRKGITLNKILLRILGTEGRMNADKWHNKRVLLKRYHHKLDAFHFCPGHKSDEDELKQIKILEQLLGDWHDRVVTIQLLRSFPGLEAQSEPVIAILKKQDRLLLGSAKIYLDKYRKWHESTLIASSRTRYG
ncbi:MAG: CHAD domain-containing protein [Gammaproteobacteria bacterium]|nr:CHAD domain-containing protein [Gammaproteobacteria bacterium]